MILYCWFHVKLRRKKNLIFTHCVSLLLFSILPLLYVQLFLFTLSNFDACLSAWTIAMFSYSTKSTASRLILPCERPHILCIICFHLSAVCLHFEVSQRNVWFWSYSFDIDNWHWSEWKETIGNCRAIFMKIFHSVKICQFFYSSDFKI